MAVEACGSCDDVMEGYFMGQKSLGEYWDDKQKENVLAYLAKVCMNNANSFKKDWSSAHVHWSFAKGSAGASAEAKKDPNKGDVTVTGEGHVDVKNDEGDTKLTVKAEASVKKDSDGKVSTSGGFKVSVEKDF
jgi:hypothetical protein